MSHPANPYQPPVETRRTGNIDDRIVLHGHVNVDDFVRLIRVPRIVIVMRVLSFIFVGPFLILPVAMLFMGTTQPVNGVGALLAIVLVLAGLLLAADRMVSRRSRVKRLIKRNPGLIGPLRGYLDAFGLTFYSESANQMQQFAWAAFPEVAVKAYGIRLDWKSADDAFVAIPSRCIDGYEPRLLRDAIARYRSQTTGPAVYQVVPDWTDMPADSIGFSNFVATHPPATRRQIAEAWIYSIVAYVAMGTVVAMFLLDWDGVYITAAIAVAVVSQVTAYPKYSKLERPRFVYGQWGWVCRDGVLTQLPGVVSHFKWSDAKNIEVASDRVVAHFDNGSAFAITPADLRRPQDQRASMSNAAWDSIVSWADSSKPIEGNPEAIDSRKTMQS